MNITFIGMHGAGKSFLGQKLADTLGQRFYDIDFEMEQECNKPLQRIVEDNGEERFLEKQIEMVLALLPEQNLVIVIGERIVRSKKAMEHLKLISNIIYIDVPLLVLQTRTDTNRLGNVGFAQAINEELYAERRPLYAAWADQIVSDDVTIEELVLMFKPYKRLV